MTWGAIGGAAVGLVGNAFLNDGGGGGGGGSGQQMYIPGGLSYADSMWQTAQGNNMGLSDAARENAMPAYNAGYHRMLGVPTQPYLQSQQQAGGAFQQVGDQAMQQMQMYGQRAQGAAGAEDMMYDAAGQVWRTAQDPQNELYGRTAQRLQDQVRSGQAARGLGNSEVGMMEEAGAMSNFNIDWDNAQLGRQATGIQAAGGAVGAGVNAGRMYGADMSAGMQAGAAGAGYYGQAGAMPFQAQQTVAGMPINAANQYMGGMGSIEQMYGNLQTAAIPYMNYGQGAQQQNWQNNYTSNRDAVNGMAQIGQAVAPKVGDWFSGSGGGNQWSSNWGNAMNQGSPVYGGDVPYG